MDIGWPEIAIIAVVVLVLFGSKKLPDAARSLGKSMRIIKTEVKGLHDDAPSSPDAATTASAPAELPAATAATDSSNSTVTAGDQTPAP